MDFEGVLELISAGEQPRNIEIKRTLSWDNTNHRAKIVKIILAMSNIRYGGFFILGFEEQGDNYKPVGIPQEDLEQLNYDLISAEVSKFADPFAVFRMESIPNPEDDTQYLVFTINEFDEIPVICKRNGAENLKTGMIYTRSRGTPATVIVPSQSEMREILRMATEKGIRAYFETTERAGLHVELPDFGEGYQSKLDEVI